MAVVVQPAFGVEVLALETQRLLQLFAAAMGDLADFPVAGVPRRPDDLPAVVGQFLRGAEVVEVVVERAGVFRAFAVEQGQGAEAAGFVEVAAVVPGAAFGDEVVALPEKLCGLAVDGFGDASAEGVVAVGRFATIGRGEAGQAVLAVVAIFGDVFAAAFADQVAVGVVGVMPIGVAQQAVALEVPGAGAVVDQQVAGRVVAEVFRVLIPGVANTGQAIERVVLVAAFAVAGVVDLCEVAVGAVGIIAAVQRSLLLPDGVGLQTALVVVGKVAVQQALLALLFSPADKGVRCQPRTIEVDRRQRPTLRAVIFKTTVVRQAQVLELATGVIAITQRAPALMLGDQSVMGVVFKLQRMVLTVVDTDQTTEAVVAVVDFAAVGQGLDQQASGRITQVSGDELRAVIAKFGFLQQLAVEVVGVRRTSPVKAGFLTDQAAGRVVQPIAVADFVFNLGEQQLSVVVAVLQLAAVGVDPPADQVQVVGVFIARDAIEFITLGGDLAVGVVAEAATGTRRKRRLQQSAKRIPLITSDRAVFVLSCRPSPHRIVGKLPPSAVGQGFREQLSKAVPLKQMAAVVRITNRQQPALGVVLVIGALAIRVDQPGDIALGVALVGPLGLTAIAGVQETVAVFVGRWLAFRRNQRDQSSELVVAVFGDGAERVLLGDQAPLRVIGFALFATVGRHSPHQSRAVVVDVDFLAAVGVFELHTTVVVPGVTGVHLRKRRPVASAAHRFTRPLPLPVKTRATGQLPLQNDVLFVVVVTFAFAGGICGFDQAPSGVVAISHQCLLGAPALAGRVKTLIVDSDQVLALVAQKQATPSTVVETLNTPGKIALHGQTVAIGIADRAQAPIKKVIKPRRLPRQRNNQLFRRIAPINRRARQAVMDRRSRQARQRKRCATVFRVDPHHGFAIDFQALGQ
ncbi:hypothetical protein PS854_05700 [Pseudomonas fluorescens]|uniref:Uncharacterized protein n=1 Tax=Pseudomonas fluorescens TaxID=294 RepID=A0A5E7Q2Q9_PSEFL|nr:hypothetical protein PS854_05700 [Pseudomonas fluorescens]